MYELWIHSGWLSMPLIAATKLQKMDFRISINLKISVTNGTAKHSLINIIHSTA